MEIKKLTQEGQPLARIREGIEQAEKYIQQSMTASRDTWINAAGATVFSLRLFLAGARANIPKDVFYLLEGRIQVLQDRIAVLTKEYQRRKTPVKVQTEIRIGIAALLRDENEPE